MKIGLILAILLFVNIIAVEATLVGVNRAQLDFTDVLRAGYAEQTFVVSVGTPYEVEFFFEPRGEIADWMRIEPAGGRQTASQDNPLPVKVIIEPPSDARVDQYTGEVLVLTGPLGEQRGMMGTDVVAAFEVKIHLSITDTQILDCTVGGLNVESAEVGMPLLFEGSVNNRGNVRINPEIRFQVYDQTEENVILEDSFRYTEDILPTASERIQTALEWELNPGQYWIRIRDETCSGSAHKTFSVLERGAIQDEVEFLGIQNEAWARTGEIVPINAQFKNEGRRVVSAQFKGTISKEGRITRVLESPPVNVNPGEQVNLEMFFTPEETGQYNIKGRVHYNNQLSFERGSMLNVQQGMGGFSLDFLTLLFIASLALIPILLFLIHKKKRK